MRLDAMPYLCEREGTNYENLPETHAVIRRMRAELDEHYPNRMFLAEANQWPEDVREYFGDGDECHMAFHFPLMPRMYMAIAQEDRHPIVEIMEQTPDIPDNCQWAVFLRNHDELTLEMVTDRERDYLYQTYAIDPQARLNLGIRRRLAPLLENDRHRIELMNLLLMTMPGSPILYYGDEIGMGDDLPAGRSQRRSHAHAVAGGAQRRIFHRRSRAAVSAAHRRSGLWLRRGECGVAAPQCLFTAQLDKTRHRDAQGAPRLWPRHAAFSAARQSQDPCLSARIRGRNDSVRGQSVAGASGGRTGFEPVQGQGTGGTDGAQQISPHRRSCRTCSP